MRVIGIDPGMAGALAYIDGQGVVGYADTPVLKGRAGSKSEYDVAGMVASLQLARGSGEAHAILELVHAMPKQGVTSVFTFGKGYGMWIGILAALQIPYTLVTPQRWKKAMLADLSPGKTQSRLRAQQMFPEMAAAFSRVKDDGRAEAALMAAWGQRQFRSDRVLQR